MLRVVSVLVSVVVVLTACTSGDDDGSEPAERASGGAAPAAASFCTGTEVRTLSTAAGDRPYLVRGPSGWDGSTALPVVYLFHGLGGQADTTLAYTGLAEVADERGFLVVAPQATGEGNSWDYRSTTAQEGSDLAGLRELMTAVGDQDCVDADRQFATGLSNGSALVLAMACSGDFPLRGYAGVAAAFYDSSCVDAPPAPIAYFHGTADEVVPFGGGPTPIEPTEPVETSMAGWARHNSCAPEPTVAGVGADVERRVWQDCDADLVAYYVDGGGHTWPGAEPLPFLGGTTGTISASQEMADFFGLD